MNNIPYNYDLTEEQEANYDDYINLLDIFKSMQTDSISIFDLDSIAIDTIENIATNCLHYPLAWSNSILEQINKDIEARYREEIPDDPGGSQRMEAPYRYIAPKEEYYQLKIYPNPAKDYLALEYNVQKPYLELSIVIVDITGKKVFSEILQGQKSQLLISLSDFKPGFYMINLIGDGTIIKSEKLSVFK